MKLEDCPLCSTVPEQCVEEHTTGSPPDTPMPAAVASFDLVGGPQMDGIKAILRCPQCGACYRRAYETESVANGPSWETTTLTRLEPVTAVAAVADVEAALEAAQRAYDVRIATSIEILRATPGDRAALDKACQSLFFSSNHLHFSAPLDVLFDVLRTHPHQEPGCPVHYLEWFLDGLARRDDARREEMRAWLQGIDPSTCPPEVEWLMRAVLPVDAAR